MAKKPTYISINERENWGMLQGPRNHVAAVGARMIDNRRRNFDIPGDRITVVGREDVAKKLHRWLFSKKTLKMIAKNSSFVWGGGAFNVDLPTVPLCKGFEAYVHVRCCGEYCYVAAYADDANKEKTDGK